MTQAQSKPTSNLLAALVYAERFGWSVFPLYEAVAAGRCSCSASASCGSAGKHPRTRQGVLEATIDRRQIEAWWANAPHANIGVATGLKSGLVVLDIDPRNGGDHGLEQLLAENAPLPDTVEQLTGGGGRHILFSRPVTEHRVVGRALAAGVDVKADGGYIVAAPSSHASGRTYEWDLEHRPGELPLAPLPDWIAQRLYAPAGANHKPTTAAVTDGYLGAAFQAAGWLGRGLGPDKAAARCPWEDEHTGGSRYDSSTIIYAPMPGRTLGFWYCSHSHCSGRSQADVRRAIPAAARAEARDRLSTAGNPPPGDETLETEQPEAAAATSGPEPWERSLRYTADHSLTKAPGNAALLIANHAAWRGCLAYNEFSDCVRWVRPVPDVPGLTAPVVGARLRDEDTGYVQTWLDNQTGVCFSREAVSDGLRLAALSNGQHPVLEYLSALAWDGTPRVVDWLHRYVGAERTSHNNDVGRMWLISAVARIFRAGCQADHLLILEGEQGGGKSTTARTLAVRPEEWFSSSLPDLRSKDAVHGLAGVWICEIGELDAFRGSAGTRVKDFVTQTVDVYRPPYGRNPIHRPRQTVFLGTTNESHYLHDVTGARRFWCVRVGVLDRVGLERDRDQLWAEARFLFDSGYPWWPRGADQIAAIEAEQSERFDSDEWESRVADYVRPREDDGVSVGDILEHALGIKPERWTRGDQMRVANCLRRLRWEKPRSNNIVRTGRRPRLWFPRETQPTTAYSTNETSVESEKIE